MNVDPPLGTVASYYVSAKGARLGLGLIGLMLVFAVVGTVQNFAQSPITGGVGVILVLAIGYVFLNGLRNVRSNPSYHVTSEAIVFQRATRTTLTPFSEIEEVRLTNWGGGDGVLGNYRIRLRAARPIWIAGTKEGQVFVQRLAELSGLKIEGA